LPNYQTMYIDSVMLEKSSSLGTYFDGNAADHHWNGTTNLSSSSQNTYNVHTFSSSDLFNITSLGTSFNSVDYLIVAGGGSGGAQGAGGGAGGMLTGSFSVGATGYPIVVGAGGTGVLQPNIGASGQNSSAFGLTAIGGGAGGAMNGSTDLPNQGLDGGSGGGSSWPYGYKAGGLGTAGQGNNGGANLAYKDGVVADKGGIDYVTPGAGGGAGGVGQDGQANGTATGGVGLSSSITGQSVVYAKGGDVLASGSSSVNGAAGTGNGGSGGVGYSNPGANGGSGIVIARYRTS